jgi:hypothetical protein
MKKVILVAALAMSFGGAFAQNTTTNNTANIGSPTAGGFGTGTVSTNEVKSGADATASNAGNTQAITFTQPGKTESVTTGTIDQNVKSTVSGDQTQRIVYSGSQTVKNVPSVSGPPLTTSNDTCMGSTSGSANGPGFGVGFGTTWTDANCVMLKNSRELWNMGMKAAAMARMCEDSANRKALEITGFVCPQTEQAERQAAARGVTTAPLAGEPTDPYVRQRMGLAPLAR